MTDRPHTSLGRYTPGQGLPLGLPPDPEPALVSTQVSDLPGAGRGTNTPRSPRSVSAPEPPRRLTAAALARIGQRLPDRDRDVLRTVGAHRYLTTRQIQQFAFHGHASADSAARTARTVTRRLWRLGLLRSLDRRVGGLQPGSDATVWQLAPSAVTLLRGERTGYRTASPSPRFLSHCLAVADVHLAVRSAADHPAVQDVAVETEPDCWRSYNGAGGERRWLQPDLFAAVRTPGFTDRWFIEVDLGTESLPTLLRKCQHYEVYRASGIEQDRHGAYPLVLWVFTRAERTTALRSALYRRSGLTPALHRFCTPSEVTSTIGDGL